MADVDRCVCCGEIVPEGRMVCPQCEYEFLNSQTGATSEEKNRRKNK